METIDIKGKSYITVNERIKHFRSKFPNWSIITSIEQIHKEGVIFKACIFDENNKIRATGHAMEKSGDSFINKTSHIENCETSAIGRALGSMGIGIDSSFASADEILNSIKNQKINGGNNV